LVSSTTQRDIWRAAGPAARERTNPERAAFSSTRDDVRATFSPDGRRIAFVTRRSGRSEVWTCETDGSDCGPVPVTMPFEGQDRPTWAPDGRRLLFEGALAGQQKAFFYVFDLIARTTEKLSSCPPDSRNAVWSADGAHVYFSADEALQLGVWKAAIDGSAPAVRILDERNFIPVAEERGYLYLARFAGLTPQQFTMTMWRLSLRTGRKEQIPGEVWSRYAVWHGKIVALEQHDAASGSWLVLIDPDTGTKRVLDELGPFTLQPAVSPDGRWVLFTRIEAERDLLLVNLKGAR
jgi:Tol biopolymer transport system component